MEKYYMIFALSSYIRLGCYKYKNILLLCSWFWVFWKW